MSNIIRGALLGALLYSFTAAAQTDPALAKKLNADEYGMKSYVMAFLKAGSV